MQITNVEAIQMARGLSLEDSLQVKTSAFQLFIFSCMCKYYENAGKLIAASFLSLKTTS